MTDIIKTIGAGKDCADWNAFFALIPLDLVAVSQRWIGRQTGTITTGVKQALTGARTTSPAFNIICEADVGAGFQDNPNKLTVPYYLNSANGATLISSVSSDDSFYIETAAYTEVRGLQFKATSPTNLALVKVASNNCKITNNIIDSASIQNAGRVSVEGDNSLVENNLLVLSGSTNGAHVALGFGYSLGCMARGNTISSPGGSQGFAIFAQGGYPVKIVNNAIFGHTAGIINYATGDSSNNATDYASTFPGTNNLISRVLATEFNSTTDYRLKSGATMRGAGVTTAGRTTGGLNQTLATPPSIGAIEYIAPAADTTAPVLSSPTGVATSPTTATITVATNEGNGTLYGMVSANAVESRATVISAGQSQVVSAAGTKTFSVTGLTANTPVLYSHFAHDDAAGNQATVVNSATFSTPAVGDTTPPTLTSPAGTKTGSTTATGSVSTNEATGILRWMTTTNATETQAAVLASSKSQAVSATGVQNITATGLPAGATLRHHFVHTDVAGNSSTVSSSATFTMDAAPANATFAQTGILRNTSGATLPDGTYSVCLRSLAVNTIGDSALAVKTGVLLTAGRLAAFSVAGPVAGTQVIYFLQNEADPTICGIARAIPT